MLVCAATFSRKQSIFFFNDTATTEIYTLSLHDALPICPRMSVARTPAVGRKVFASQGGIAAGMRRPAAMSAATPIRISSRSEEHTSELQSRQYLVCRLLLAKKTISSLSTSTGSVHVRQQ